MTVHLHSDGPFLVLRGALELPSAIGLRRYKRIADIFQGRGARTPLAPSEDDLLAFTGEVLVHSNEACRVAIMFPGLGSDSRTDWFQSLKPSLREHGWDPMTVSPRGVGQPWSRFDTGQTDFGILGDVAKAHLSLRPNATAILLIAHSGGGASTSHAIGAGDVLPPNRPIAVAGFAAIFDLDWRENPFDVEGADEPLNLKSFSADPKLLATKPVASIALWGVRDDLLSREECSIGDRLAEPMDADHFTILTEQSAVECFSNFLTEVAALL